MPAQADARPMPVLQGRTHRDIAQHAVKLQQWGLACEADKRLLREVYGEQP